MENKHINVRYMFLYCHENVMNGPSLLFLIEINRKQSRILLLCEIFLKKKQTKKKNITPNAPDWGIPLSNWNPFFVHTSFDMYVK